MSCIPIKDGFLCGFNPQYKYTFQGKEYYFEWHSYCGPHPLKKDGELKKLVPHRYSKFWNMVSEFQQLSSEERKKYEV